MANKKRDPFGLSRFDLVNGADQIANEDGGEKREKKENEDAQSDVIVFFTKRYRPDLAQAKNLSMFSLQIVPQYEEMKQEPREAIKPIIAIVRRKIKK
ncbi:hypothetical protein Nepgr_013850 [Nepenthes gracilis]|uniref:Uncharacterized protein n=1 Tax=Nepenthes gracilis TaxID=150966 RepID=A0AAD3SJM9_NEPGR|nr:hypothetical protein Nepgr_013850 [Nepenthes gracilis]